MSSTALTGYVTYNELNVLFGKRMAYVALALIEKSAGVRTDDVIEFDCDIRLSQAFDAMRDKSLAA
jgi:hypothetical protein